MVPQSRVVKRRLGLRTAIWLGGGDRRFMHIRNFRSGDELALHAVFYSAVHQVASQYYTAEQINAWAPPAFDAAAWTVRMREIRPFVVENAGELVAYADVQPSGYIDHFFVSGASARQGIGTRLMEHIHETAYQQKMTLLTANVSRSAQAFFERFGFVVVEYRTPMTRGVVVPNALMKKELSPDESS